MKYRINEELYGVRNKTISSRKGKTVKIREIISVKAFVTQIVYVALMDFAGIYGIPRKLFEFKL